MYGTRRAADGWHCEYSDTLEELGFVRGQSSACVFWHPSRHLRCSVHGDDFTTTGPKESLDWFREKMEQKYELKEAARLGPGSGDDKEGRILNRIVRWETAGLTHESDPRQSEKLLQELVLDQVQGTNPIRAVSTPCVRLSGQAVATDKKIDKNKVSHFRGLAAIANYLAADIPDIPYAAKEM